MREEPKTISFDNIGVTIAYHEARHAEAVECIRKLRITVEDVLPQMGGIVLQDYANLNEGMGASRKLLNEAGVTKRPSYLKGDEW